MKAVLMTSSILIVLIAALRPLLRGKIPPKVQYALWLVAALRLLLPVNLFTSAYSALALLDRAEEPAQIVQAIGQTAIPVQSYDSARAEVMDYLQQLGIQEADFTPADLTAIDQQARELMRGPTVGELAAKLARPVWLAGAALTAGWFLLVNTKLRRKLKNAKRLGGVDCPLPVYVSDALPSPCLCGALRPAIYITPAALDDPSRLRHVLAHELTHYRHRDHWWAVLRCVCLCAYWFDPLVWWAAALSRQDCELACDEGAIRALGEEERIPYGRTLVAMIAAGRSSLLQAATTMTGSRRRVRARIQLIARKPKTVAAVALALALIVGCAVGCTFTGAPEVGPDPDASPSLSPDAPRPTLDTLQARLEDIPAELRGDVALYHGDAPEPEHSTTLALYMLDNPSEEEWEGWLCSLHQWDQVGFEDWLYSVHATRTNVFARDGEHYYAFSWPTSVQYADEDAQRYAAASRAIGDYAEQQVLSTEGVEPYDPTELRQREYLWEGKTYTDVAYWPYKNITGDTEGSVWIIRLVQLAKDGEGGVWIPEREQIIDADVDSTPQHVKPSETREMGLTVTEYAQYLQQEADAGRADWATDPIQACMHYALTDFGHSEANVTEDCFTRDSTYIQDVVNSTLPTEEELAIQAVMDGILYSSSQALTLAPAGSSRVYAYQVDAPLNSYLTYQLTSFAESFDWEKLTVLPEGAADGDGLIIQAADSLNCVWAYSKSNMIAIRTPDNQIEYYMAHDRGGDPDSAPLGTPILNPGPYQLLRNCFDEVELQQLRATSVPDRGQSHENVVVEWVEGFEGAMTRCAPGSQYACTDVRVRDVRADAHADLTPEEMADFAQYNGNGLAAEDYGKTWFSFGYSLVFVSENGSDTNNPLWAGNTWYYEGDDAPEGALTYSRVGYMQLIDGNWVCEGCGTGW